MILKISMIKRTKNLENVIFLCISLIFSILILNISQNIDNWKNFFGLFNIDILWPPFGDIRSHQNLPLTVDQGMNPYLEHPNDPWNRTVNYPYIWYYISKYLKLPNENFFLTYVFFIIFFYTFFFNKIIGYVKNNKLLAIITPIIFFSSSSMLVIERGNTDLILFSIIFISCMSNYFVTSLTLTTFGILIKIYPIVISYIFLKKLKNLIYFSLLIILIVYFNIDHFKYYFQNTSSTYDAGIVYGIKSLLNGYPKAFERLGFSLESNLIIDFFIYFIIFIILVFTFFAGFKKSSFSNEKINLDFYEKLFLCGSTIYISTFLVLSNYDYRLIFLIMTFPYIAKKKLFFFDYIFLFATILSTNSIFLFEFARKPIDYLFIGLILHVFKFYILLYLTYNFSEIVKKNLNFFPFKFFKSFKNKYRI